MGSWQTHNVGEAVPLSIPKKSWHVFEYQNRNIQVELTLLRWGFGFDFGYCYDFGISLWVGPLYLSVGIAAD